MVRPSILFPLYLWPGPGAWKPLYDQIDKAPNVKFDIIINPDSGPGTSNGGAPDPTWIKTMTKLNNKRNTQMIGYVHVGYGNRPVQEVKDDVSAYASWSSYRNANISLSGIFFDEAPSDGDDTLVEYMRDVTQFARDSFDSNNNDNPPPPSPSPPARVVFNPGCPADRAYYGLADQVVGFEDYAARYANDPDSFPMNSLRDPGSRRKTAFIIQGFRGTAAQQKSIVANVARNNISGIYISTTGDYSKFSRFWPQLVAQVNGVQS